MMYFRSIRLAPVYALAALLCTLLGASAASAAIIADGDVSPDGGTLFMLGDETPYDEPADAGGPVIVGGTELPANDIFEEFGTLTLTDPAFTRPLLSTTGIIAGTPNSIGQVEVGGFLSEWDVSEQMIVGEEGIGYLDIVDGGLVKTDLDAGTPTIVGDDAIVGLVEGSQGFVSIAGLGSRWEHYELRVGDEGFGVINVTNGGRLITLEEASLGVTYDLSSGNNSIGTGRVTVSGAGSRWYVGSDPSTGTDELIVGDEAWGEIEALAGGVIRVYDDLTLAQSTVNAYGVARVSGRDSRIWTHETMRIATVTAGARADVYVEDYGVLRADATILVGERATVNLDGGTVLTPTITNDGVIRGDGTIDIGSAGTMVNNGEMRVAADIANQRERMLVTGTIDSTSGVIEAIGGEMEIRGGLTAGEVRIWDDGVVRVGGALEFLASSVFNVSLSPSVAAIVANGGATLAGELNVEFDFGFNPGVDDVFELITGGAISGTFNPTAVTTPTDWEVVYLPDRVLLANVATAPIFASADFDLDNDVDAVDLGLWEAGYGIGSGAVKGDGDADNDADVDGSDFLLWQQQNGFSTPATANAGAVPEPGAVALALTAVVGLALRRRVR